MHAAVQMIGILDLSGNDFGADAMEALATAILSRLNQLHAAAATGAWLEFECLTLSDNNVDIVAMQPLAQGQWSNIIQLSLGTNVVETFGAAFLM